MRVALIHNAVFPVRHYGGTERVVWWLAKGLKEQGHRVTLVAAPGSSCPFAEIQVGDFISPDRKPIPDVDIEHHFAPPPTLPSTPYLVTVEGNGKAGERFPANTVFVSRNHAERHGSRCFVYNGIDPDDVEFSLRKEDYLVFLAKAAWKVKNVEGAIRVARRSGVRLQILGGSRWWCPSFRGVRWRGMVGGEKKRRLLAGARGLLFPVLWHEPFGIAVVEALLSGAPVVASPFGSLPELVTPEVGALCGSLTEMVEEVKGLDRFSAQRCHDYAREKFHYRKMTSDYVGLYERVIRGERLNPEDPRTVALPGPLALND